MWITKLVYASAAFRQYGAVEQPRAARPGAPQGHGEATVRVAACLEQILRLLERQRSGSSLGSEAFVVPSVT